MTKYVLRRLLWTIPLLFGVSIICFGLLKRAPGDPVTALLIAETGADGGTSVMTSQDIETLREQYGLNKPVYAQYVDWLKLALRGEFGRSTRTNEPVLDVILTRAPNTLQLVGISLVLTLLVALPLGVLSAVRQYSVLDHLLTLFTFVAISLPSFWLTLVLIYGFSVILGWLPTGGLQSVDADGSAWNQVGDRLRHLILPVVALTLGGIGYYMRYQRAAMLDVIRQDYVQTARAKGLPDHQVILRHAWRNALIPIITLLGYVPVWLFEGSIVVETIFAWPGTGRLAILSLQYRDYPVVMTIALLSATLVLVGMLLSDILYAIVDPRVRYV